MPGIGITLNDMGLNNDPSYTPPPPSGDESYPKEFDFSLHLSLLGSWWQVCDALRNPGNWAFEDEQRVTPLWFSLNWGPVENESEESIKARLTGLRYSKVVHDAFEQHLYDWAQGESEEDIIRLMVAPGMPHQESVKQGLAINGCTPSDILEELVSDPENRYTLLENPNLLPGMVRDIHDAIKDDEFGPMAMARSESELPDDVLLELASRDYAHDSEVPWTLQDKRELSEGILLALIGKCDFRTLLENRACTDKVRDEIEKRQSAGSSLSLADRERTMSALERVRSSIKSGRTGGIIRRRGEELALLESVQTHPDLTVGLAHLVLERGVTIQELARHRQNEWVVADLETLGLPALEWKS